MTGLGARELLASHPRQPDQRSCGAACLVVARAITDEAYAELLTRGRHPVTHHRLFGDLATRWEAEVLALHRRTTSSIDLAGRTQPPWPRALGTPPWSVARFLSAVGPRHVVRRAGAATLAEVVSAVDDGLPVPLYVGSRRLPRHVVLALHVGDGVLWTYDPSTGRTVSLPLGDLAAGRAAVAGWSRWWWAVVPAELNPEPRSPA